MHVSTLHELYTMTLQSKPEEAAKVDAFWAINSYVKGSYDKQEDFDNLNREIGKIENGLVARRLFYLALPPSVFAPVTSCIKAACMSPK